MCVIDGCRRTRKNEWWQDRNPQARGATIENSMGILDLIPGLPAGANLAIVCVTILVVLLSLAHAVTGGIAFVKSIGKPKPKAVSVRSILDS